MTISKQPSKPSLKTSLKTPKRSKLKYKITVIATDNPSRFLVTKRSVTTLQEYVVKAKHYKEAKKNFRNKSLSICVRSLKFATIRV